MKLIKMIYISMMLVAQVPGLAQAKPAKRESSYKIVQATCISDSYPSSGEVSVVTSDDSFATIRIFAKTKIEKNCQKVDFAQIKRGIKITGKGSWDGDMKNIFQATYIFIADEVSESYVADRVAAACNNISSQVNGAHSSSGKSSASSKTGNRSQTPMEQLATTDWNYYQSKRTSFIFGNVKNLTKRPFTEFTATAHYYTKSGQYIVSTMPMSPQCLTTIYADGRANFKISTKWIENEYPELPSRCVIEFESLNNKGDLITTPAKLELEAQDFRSFPKSNL